MSEQQSHSEPGSLHLQLEDVMRAKFDVRDGNYIQKWQQNGTFHVCYQVAPSANVIMTGEEHDDYNTSAAAESHLIHLFCVINKTSLCIHGGVFVEAGRLNPPAN